MKVKHKHPTELDIVCKLLHGCHICGTGEITYSHSRNCNIYGYHPCRVCYNEYRSHVYQDESALFYNLSRYYQNSIDIEYYIFLHDQFCREQLRKIRNGKGIYEPNAYCNSCKKVLPLFDIGMFYGKYKIKHGVVHGNFTCFECLFYERNIERVCFTCGRFGYLHHYQSDKNTSSIYICNSCQEIFKFDRKIKAERKIKLYELRALERLHNYARYLLRRSGIENPDDQVTEMKVIQLTMKRTVKQYKKWRKENESDHTDVHGKQCSDEVYYERGVQAGTSICSATGI